MLKLVALSLLAIVCVFADQPDIRRIDSGQVQGVYDTSRNIRYWKGIPFAGDTSGANRFSAPQPVQPWSGIRNCSDWAPGCRQIHHNPDVPDVQSEDCLNLNVYVPGGTLPGDNLPVMIWIHGGAFSEGCNQGPFGLYDGGYIAKRGNVIVVTINYRLGAFGFLVTDQLRGNFGFLDQRAAMQWVQRNIAIFGGDPSQVTLFGESAGAMSIGYHIVAPGSKGLFKRAILESNVNMLLHNVKQAQFYGESFCKAAGCGEKTCNNTCLRALSDAAVVEAWKKSADDFMAYIKANWQHMLDGFVMQFAPIVDGSVIPMEAIAALQAGQFNPGIDVLEGQNTEDGQTFVYGGLDTPLPVFLYEAAVDIVFAPYGKQIIARYKDPAQKDGRWLLSEVVTDYLFRCSTQQFSMAAAKAGNTAWTYTYKHVFSASWIWKKFGLPDLCANHSCHMAEVPFIFHNEVHTADLNVTFTAPESALSDAMIDYWTSFAVYGNPNKSGRTSFTWPPYDPAQRKGLLIDEQMAVDDNADLCSFWDKVGYSH